MKRVSTLALVFVLSLFAIQTFATTHYVTVTDTAIVPDNFNALVGDTVIWSFSAGNVYQSNTASDTIPFGATPWASASEEGGGPDFMYIITIPGTYRYMSTIYYPLVASFTVPSISHHIIITDTAFLPDNFFVSVGDTIIWQAALSNASNNNTTSSSIPGYAATWSSGALTPGQTFSYIATAPGPYTYQSNTQNTFTGKFSVLGNYTHYVLITDTGFVPNYFTANVGDTVTWVAAPANQTIHSSTPDTNSYSIPVDAFLWYSGLMAPGDSFSYVIQNTGSYYYYSDTNNVDSSLYASFSVGNGEVTSGLPRITSQTAKLVFQNPFINQLNILSGEPGLVTIYDMLGNRVATKQLEFSSYPVQIDMGGLNAGMYLVTFSIQDKLVQTYKAIKVN